MKRFCVAVMVAMLGLAVMTPSANAIGLMASWWQLNDANEDGFGAGLKNKMPIIPLVAIDTRASWINFSDSDMNVFPLEVTGLVTLGLLYGGLGVGYYIFDAENFDLDNAFGWYVLVGAEIGLGGFGVFGELKWTDLSVDASNVDPDLGDVPTSLEADGMGLNIGINFGIPKK